MISYSLVLDVMSTDVEKSRLPVPTTLFAQATYISYIGREFILVMNIHRRS